MHTTTNASFARQVEWKNREKKSVIILRLALLRYDTRRIVFRVKFLAFARHIAEIPERAIRLSLLQSE
jgi:hypothetical protein